MRVLPLPAFRDNYIFALEIGAREVALVDPGTADPAREYLARSDRHLAAILVTHHHSDHVGGVLDLLRGAPGIPVFGGAADRGRIPGQTHFLEDGATVEVAGRAARVLAVPGHTLGHVAYFFPDADEQGGDLFSGDTIFGCTVGNLFEGTADQMFESMRKLRRLPLGTRIWCAHEYTLTYVREELQNDPGNRRLVERVAEVEAQVRSGRPTVPLRMADERATNPFFRWDDPAVRSRCGTLDDLSTFRKLCE